MSDATKRFSDRVADYIRYRPGYPAAIVDLLKPTQDAVIADIGSGTGLSARPFLERGYRVVGVEPNAEMREAGEALLAEFPQFTSIDGRAEATGLDAGSIDLIIVGQAFHWFDAIGVKAEFRRILKPGGMIALVWNEWKISTPFMCDIQALTDKYQREDGRKIRDDSRTRIAEFFAPVTPQRTDLENTQEFDFDGVWGRLVSSSYLPRATDPEAPAMMRDARAVFDRHVVNERVCWVYETEVWRGIPA